MKQSRLAPLFKCFPVFIKRVLPKSRAATFALAVLIVILSFAVSGTWTAFSTNKSIALSSSTGAVDLSLELKVNGLPDGPLVAGNEYWLSYGTDHVLNTTRGRIQISVDAGGPMCRHFSWDSEVGKGPGHTGFSPGRPLYVPRASEGVTVIARLFVDGSDVAVVSSEVRIPVEGGESASQSIESLFSNMVEIGIPFFRK